MTEYNTCSNILEKLLNNYIIIKIRLITLFENWGNFGSFSYRWESISSQVQIENNFNSIL